MAVYKNTPKMQDTDIERERTDRQTDRQNKAQQLKPIIIRKCVIQLEKSLVRCHSNGFKPTSRGGASVGS